MERFSKLWIVLSYGIAVFLVGVGDAAYGASGCTNSNTTKPNDLFCEAVPNSHGELCSVSNNTMTCQKSESDCVDDSLDLSLCATCAAKIVGTSLACSELLINVDVAVGGSYSSSDESSDTWTYTEGTGNSPIVGTGSAKQYKITKDANSNITEIDVKSGEKAKIVYSFTFSLTGGSGTWQLKSSNAGITSKTTDNSDSPPSTNPYTTLSTEATLSNGNTTATFYDLGLDLKTFNIDFHAEDDSSPPKVIDSDPTVVDKSDVDG